ncbi:rRNA maturation RNase YbeY [Candidatus Sumerlaeota bacterium]|nr:rRNA maturation RNase YbeY [Candidatus Sumerlaeota bacterium]MBI3736118.1 rRNA maturation RNase YbeY [Candidatus Sumerlaeota bacterium]
MGLRSFPPKRRRHAGNDPVIQFSVAGRLGRYASGLEPFCRNRLAAAGERLGLDRRHEISLLLCDGPAIRRINRRWRGMDRPTDVLSFPLEELKAGSKPATGALGDIIVSLPLARRGAIELGLPFDRHLAHLLVHGLLHLLGYDHIKATDAKMMERKEKELLEAWK